MRTVLPILIIALLVPTTASAQVPTQLAPEESGPGGLPDLEASDQPEDGEPAPATELPPLEEPSLAEAEVATSAQVVTSCSFEGPTSFTMKQGESPLLDISFKRCTLSVGSDGVLSASISVQAMFHLEADVSQCSILQIAMLFEGRSAGERLHWKGEPTVVRELLVTTVEGDKADLGYFVLHDQVNDHPISLAQLMTLQESAPGYPELYWGDATILQEDSSGPLSTEIRSILPAVHRKTEAEGDGPVDLAVPLVVGTYPPHGWCIAKDAAGRPVQPTLLISAPLSGQPE